MTCKIHDCEEMVVSRGMCRFHYSRWYRQQPVDPSCSISSCDGARWINYGYTPAVRWHMCKRHVKRRAEIYLRWQLCEICRSSRNPMEIHSADIERFLPGIHLALVCSDCVKKIRPTHSEGCASCNRSVARVA